jgi:homoserine dehydrogenase
MEARTGRRLGAQSLAQERDVKSKRYEWFDDPVALADPNVDVFVELIGGSGRARQGARWKPRWRAAPMSSPPTRRWSPSTARSSRLSPSRTGAKLLFEAAVGGGVPMVKALRDEPRWVPRAASPASSTAPATTS